MEILRLLSINESELDSAILEKIKKDYVPAFVDADIYNETIYYGNIFFTMSTEGLNDQQIQVLQELEDKTLNVDYILLTTGNV